MTYAQTRELMASAGNLLRVAHQGSEMRLVGEREALVRAREELTKLLALIDERLKVVP